MSDPAPAQPVDEALVAIEADVLPTLSALLASVTDCATLDPRANFEARSAELRDMSRQIIELTRFLAAVTADACAQDVASRIRA